MKAKIIIQARSGSRRLPGKVLLKIMDKTVIEYLLERVRRADTIDDIIVATTTKEEDLCIIEVAQRLGVNTFGGSDEDVLDRFYQAARKFNARHIVRITADSPLMDPAVIDDVASYYFKTGADYCSNALEPSYPVGEAVEIFGFFALEAAWKNARLLSEREHVTPYIWKHPHMFKLANLKNKTDLSGKRWTLDQKEDFQLIKAILEGLYPIKPDFHMDDILNFLRDRPHLEEVNRGIAQNEGYLKSLREDKIVGER